MNMVIGSRSRRAWLGGLGVTLCIVTASASVLAAEGVLLEDDFSAADIPGRRAIRGAWKMEAGVASCTQDDELYKQYKNHGPIIFYDLPLTDAVVRFAFKAEDAKAVTFTANGVDGHIFRVSWGARGSTVRAFPPHAESKSVSVGQDEHPLPLGEWIPVEVTLDGARAVVKVGDGPAQVFEHASFDRPKTNISVGFSFGRLSVRNLSVREPAATL